jgi:hypothetical protein
MAFVRPAFVARIDAEIAANENKGPWAAWQPDPMALESQIQHHFRKLRRALRDRNPAGVSEYAADIAALCMKADELHGSP